MLKITKFIREVCRGNNNCFEKVVQDDDTSGIPSDSPSKAQVRYQSTDTSWWFYSMDATAWLPLNDDAKTLYDA
jgi:hypothetical protein